MIKSSQHSENSPVKKLDNVSRSLAIERVSRATAIAVGPNPSLSRRQRGVLPSWIQPKPIFHQLCSCCTQIVQTSEIIQSRLLNAGLQSKRLKDGTETFCHYPKLGDIAESASQGCHLCSLLLPKRRPHLRFTDQTPYVCDVNGFQIFAGITIKIGVNIEVGQADLRAPSEYQLDPGKYLLSFRTDSDETFSCARDWLSTCLKSHQMCKVNTSGACFNPSRLLKISITNAQLSVQLYLTEGLLDNIPYLALSHCWGGAKILQLTKDKLEDFIISIPLADLPQTFLDAVAVAARLGYEYIWIDSLCIIQDSENDWKEEVKSMARVYSNSVLTIAALHATNSAEGCFTSRNPMELMECRAGDGDLSSFYPSYPPNEPWDEDLLRPLLHRRGWVVQERILSPRTLYYGSQVIFWECVQCTASEVSPRMEALWSEDNSALRSSSTTMKSVFKSLLNVIKSEHEQGSMTWKKFWRGIVKDYTDCQLTNSTDRWEAISGLAKEVELNSGLELFHGLWKTNLVEELLWFADKPRKRLEMRAPSWSWISIDAKVIWGFWIDVYSPNLKSTAVVSFPAPSHDSSPASIIVEAPLLSFSEIFPGCKGAYPSDGISLDIVDGMEPNLSWFYWHPDTNESIDNSRCSALQLVYFEEKTYTKYGGLVVKPVDESELIESCNAWSRVGYYYAIWNNGDFEHSRQAPATLGTKRKIILI